ncbi:hypothetical protein scyTo_0026011, partial [Scyliorhinus torazame]|nr:hypothetical protein [Scyliorhinus torazame]
MSYLLEPGSNPSSCSRRLESRSYSSRSSGFRSQSWSRGGGGGLSTSSSCSRRLGSLQAPGRAYSSADSLELSQGSGLNGEQRVAGRSSSEKELLQGLNDRFAGYIDKVHCLEQHNKQLDTELQAHRHQQLHQGQLGQVYEGELRELRELLQQVQQDKGHIQLQSEHLEEDLQRLRERLEEEARQREDTEANIRALAKETQQATLLQAELDKKAQSLQEEVSFLRANHQEEVAELCAQIQAPQLTLEPGHFPQADLTSALREIRAQLQGHSAKNLQQTEEWFKGRYAKLNQAAQLNKDAIRSARDEITEYRRQLQSKSIELESVRGTKESLERQLTDIEDRHTADASNYQ